ncbi:MAG: hypothetical protein KTR24_06490 [Saprospiraceae bacterium]|nr:hypothetical protein [Saprospiraceae bacterium]
MKEQFEASYKKKMEGLSLDPPARAWERLEVRLDQDQGKMKTVTFRRWMSLVASIAILAASYAIFHSHQQEMVLEDLEAMPMATFTAYKYVEECHLIYGNEHWNANAEQESMQATGAILPNPAVVN